MNIKDDCTWLISKKTCSVVLIMFLLLFYNRLDGILLNKINFYKYYSANLKGPAYLKQYQHGRMIHRNCSYVLNEENILYNNIYWQKLMNNDGKFLYLYSAHYDNRTLLKNNPVIRIITMFEKPLFPAYFYCYLWFADKDHAIVTKTTDIHKLIVGERPSQDNPYIITCPIPFKKRHKIPISVSLSINKCGSITNYITVLNIKPENPIKKDFVVCLKALNYVDVDMSLYMVEWLELLFLMGVDKVFAYEYTVHPNISKVLKYYSENGRLSVTPITLPGDAPNDPNLRTQYLQKASYRLANNKIPLNDCFYQNMNKYKYIAVMDLDEIFVPRKFKTWNELIYNLSLKGRVSYSSYKFQRIIILDAMRGIHGWSDSVPKYMYMSQNIYRSPIYEEHPKSIYNTEHVISMQSHGTLACLTNYNNITFKCRNMDVKTTDAHVLHYRQSCKSESKEKFCMIDSSIKDETILRYSDQLIEKTSYTLKKLGLI